MPYAMPYSKNHSPHITSILAFGSMHGIYNFKALQDRLSLVRCLIPRTTVPMSAVFQCLGSMHVQPGSLQRALFRWLVLVFDLLEDGRSLTATYDLIFHFLQYDSLRPAVAQLLCYMTTREHGGLCSIYLLFVCLFVCGFSLFGHYKYGPVLV